jgi:hypothetical protein
LADLKNELMLMMFVLSKYVFKLILANKMTHAWVHHKKTLVHDSYWAATIYHSVKVSRMTMTPYSKNYRSVYYSIAHTCSGLTDIEAYYVYDNIIGSYMYKFKIDLKMLRYRSFK